MKSDRVLIDFQAAQWVFETHWFHHQQSFEAAFKFPLNWLRNFKILAKLPQQDYSFQEYRFDDCSDTWTGVYEINIESQGNNNLKLDKNF